jgi:hypothetical protein
MVPYLEEPVEKAVEEVEETEKAEEAKEAIIDLFLPLLLIAPAAI